MLLQIASAGRCLFLVHVSTTCCTTALDVVVAVLVAVPVSVVGTLNPRIPPAWVIQARVDFWGNNVTLPRSSFCNYSSVSQIKASKATAE